MQTDTPDRILRLKAVLARTGLSRSTMYRKMDAGTFPPQHKDQHPVRGVAGIRNRRMDEESDVLLD